MADWNFDQGKGSVLRDVSGNGNDGTVHGAKWVKVGQGISTFGELPAAVGILSEAVRRFPEDHSAHWALGITLHMLGRQADAARYLEQALRLHPNDPSIESRLATTYGLMGRDPALKKRAVALFEKALASRPHDWESWAFYGR